jgi:hypothetical protein
VNVRMKCETNYVNFFLFKHVEHLNVSRSSIGIQFHSLVLHFSRVDYRFIIKYAA